jgi:flagellar hook-length control protein FliK
MTEVLPIAASLNATPLADPLAAPTVPTTDEADPFAELLAVMVAPVAVTPTTTPTTKVPDAPVSADSTSLSSDDSDAPTPDVPISDDGTLDDRLAASVSAMLAIAPPPPPPVATPITPPVALPAASERSAKAPEISGATTRKVAMATTPIAEKATRKAAAPVIDAVTDGVTDTQSAPAPTASQSDGVSVIDPAPSTDADLPARTAVTASDKSADAPSASTSKSTSATATATATVDASPVRAATTPTLPAAILRMLREAPATNAQPPVSIAPVAPMNPRDAIAATQATIAAQPGASASRDVADSARRDVRTTTERPTASTARPVAAKASRVVETARHSPADPIPLPFVDARAPAPVADGTSGQNAAPVDSLVQGQLAIGRDGQWLDSLARDIAASASGGDLHFKLAPENLGALTVSIAAQADGAAIRMTADTDRAHQILTEAQPRLIAEARAQGLRVSESHVELNNGSNGGGSSAWGQAGGQAQPQGERRQQTSSPNRLPFQPSINEEAIDAPAQRTSERYA